MFQPLTNQTWTVSDEDKVSVAATQDTSMDGSSDKIVFEDALNEYAELAFDAIILSGFEEVVFWLYLGRRITALDNILTVTVAGEDYPVPKPDRSGWSQVLIDCQALGSAATLRITSLLPDQTVFFDYAGARKFDPATVDTDVIDSIKSAVSLDYNVSTTLSADAAVGDESIRLTSDEYVFNTSRLMLSKTDEDDVTTTEIVNLISKSGNLKAALVNDFPAGSSVTVLCPVEGEDAEGIEADPVCGVNIVGIETRTGDNHAVDMLGGASKIKNFLGDTSVQVYIDSTSKLKVLELSRKFQAAYGSEFRILLDGDAFDIYLESSLFLDSTEAGNNPRMSWFYKIASMPVTVETLVRVTDQTVSIESEEHA